MYAIRETGGFLARTRDTHRVRPSWWTLLATFPWVIGLVLSIYIGLADRAIAQRQLTTEGTVTTHEPANHDRYGYTFNVSGKPYSGWESPRHGKLIVGQQVLVYYDPNNPRKSALISFWDLSIESFGPIPLLALGTAFVAVYVRRRRRNQLIA